MLFFFELSGILAGCLLPFFLVTAIKAEGEKAQNYTALACLAGGYLVFFLINVVSIYAG